MNLAGLADGAGDLDQAVGLLQQAVATAPEFEQAHFNLASALSRLGRSDEAVARYDALLEIEPRFPSARCFRAMALTQTALAAEAEPELRQLLAQSPSDWQARRGLADLLARLNRLDEALSVIGEAPDASDAAASADQQVEIASLLTRAGRLDDALAAALEASAADPSHVEAQLAAGRLLLAAGRFEEAATRFSTAVEQRPDSVELRLSEVDARWLLGNCDTARQRLEDGLRHSPRSAGLTEALARLLATCPDESTLDGDVALRLAQELYAARATPRFAETLVMALAEAETAADTPRAARLRADLGAYAIGRPVRLLGLTDDARRTEASAP